MEDLAPFLVWLLVETAIGGICAAIANSRGRNAVGWFFVGFLFGCLPIIILLVLPNPKEEERKFRRIEQENRRLRETLRKDRMVSDDRQGNVDARLGAHDRALGLDTRGMGTVVAPVEPPTLPDAGAEPAPWYYAVGGERRGPVAASALRDLWSAGDVDDATLVWRKGMGEWQRIATVAELGAGSGESGVG